MISSVMLKEEYGLRMIGRYFGLRRIRKEEARLNYIMRSSFICAPLKMSLE